MSQTATPHASFAGYDGGYDDGWYDAMDGEVPGPRALREAHLLLEAETDGRPVDPTRETRYWQGYYHGRTAYHATQSDA